MLPIVALALAALAAGCGNEEAEPQLEPGPIRVGLLLGGPSEQLIAAGAQVAADELNNGGGVDGVARVDLVVARPAAGGDYAGAAGSLLSRRVSAIVLSCEQFDAVAAAVRGRAVLLAPCVRRSSILPPSVFGTGLAIDDPAVRAKRIPGRKLDEFYERYKALYGVRPPTSIPALGYDALRVFAVAAEEAGSRRPEPIEEQLDEGLEVGGAFGKIRFDEGRRRPVVELRNVSAE